MSEPVRAWVEVDRAKAVVVVQVPGLGLFGHTLRRFRADRFESLPPTAVPGNARLEVYDGEQCVALFPAGSWLAVWRGDLEWEPPGDGRREDDMFHDGTG